MTRLAITDRANGDTAIFHGFNLNLMQPADMMERIDRALSWLCGQPAPLIVCNDDGTGLVAALIVGWLLTNTYACKVTIVRLDDTPLVAAGIGEDGRAFFTAYTKER